MANDSRNTYRVYVPDQLPLERHPLQALLSVRLLPLLRNATEIVGSASFISIVGSRLQTMHTYSKHPIPEETWLFELLNDRAHYQIQRYADSKVLVSMWVRELAKHGQLPTLERREPILRFPMRREPQLRTRPARCPPAVAHPAPLIPMCCPVPDRHRLPYAALATENQDNRVP
ncbi:hypothetical protein C8R43DRAFT_1003201 [Mycena crocata]|nr:hypothetical protein C8R43DRAFT_1003201 [Mycena crocata]